VTTSIPCTGHDAAGTGRTSEDTETGVELFACVRPREHPAIIGRWYRGARRAHGHVRPGIAAGRAYLAACSVTRRQAGLRGLRLALRTQSCTVVVRATHPVRVRVATAVALGPACAAIGRVSIEVSQPSVSGAADALQSPRPARQVYVHVVPLQPGAPVVLSQTTPHALQLSMVFGAPQSTPASIPASTPASGAETQAPPWHVVPAEHGICDCHVPVLSHVCGVNPEHCTELGTHVPEQVPAPVHT
jgi:hypothetical protein